MNGKIAPKSIVVGAADLISQWGRRSRRARTGKRSGGDVDGGSAVWRLGIGCFPPAFRPGPVDLPCAFLKRRHLPSSPLRQRVPALPGDPPQPARLLPGFRQGHHPQASQPHVPWTTVRSIHRFAPEGSTTKYKPFPSAYRPGFFNDRARTAVSALTGCWRRVDTARTGPPAVLCPHSGLDPGAARNTTRGSHHIGVAKYL